MSASCGVVECVLCVGCTRWAWKRLTYVGAYDSATWPLAAADDFAAVPRVCRIILAVYDPDLSNPKFAPPGGYGLNPEWVVRRVTHAEAGKLAPPYIIYADRDAREVVLAIRGLNLTRESDYAVLLDNRLGRSEMFDGGFVHHGLLKSAKWILERESGTLREQLRQVGPDAKLVLTGHSLGSGIAALATVLAVNNRGEFDDIPRERIKCYAIAPARCMSLNLAVKYADVINSIVLQDDFLPRTPTPLEHIFGSIFCLPCLLFLVCLRDTIRGDKAKLNDHRRLYAPGRMYHIVDRKFCRCGRFPPEVRTAIPIEGRFEHIVLSCGTTSDHAIAWIEREATKALELLMESDKPSTPPTQQKMTRTQTLQEEHQNALEKAQTLNVLDGVDPSEEPDNANSAPPDAKPDLVPVPSSAGRSSWDALMIKLFTRNESGKLVINREVIEE